MADCQSAASHCASNHLSTDKDAAEARKIISSTCQRMPPARRLRRSSCPDRPASITQLAVDPDAYTLQSRQPLIVWCVVARRR
jgi:hypothetical protein